MMIIRGTLPSAGRQGGAVAIIVGLLLFVLAGTAAFAIDVGRWLVVDNELQNGSDAAALAGAGYLLPLSEGKPNWTKAESEAHLAVPLNASEKIMLKVGTVVTGYWDFTNRTFDSDTSKSWASGQLPAVRVSTARTGTENGGPVSMMFARLFGTETIDSAATATAVVSLPKSAGKGALAPIAISNCLTQEGSSFWDSASQVPKGDPPHKFVITTGAANQCDPERECGCGQWTTFDLDKNDVPTVEQLITEGNATELGVGDQTWIQPGVKADLYETFDSHLTGMDIIVPLVKASIFDKEQGAQGFQTEIVGWACLHVFNAVKTKGTCEVFEGEKIPSGEGVEKFCIILSFSPDACKMPGAEGGAEGVFAGVYVPPRLVQ